MSLLATLPQISLGTAAVLIFATFMAYVLLRGVGRLMVGTAMLTASAILGFLTWQKAPEISIAVFNKSVGFVTTGLPIMVFVASFIVLRIALKWVANPFGGGEDEEIKDRRGLSKTRIVVLLGFALIPTLVVMIIAAGIIHHTASVQELRQTLEAKTDQAPSYAQQLKGTIEAVVPDRLLKAMDPYAEKSRMALAKWVTRNQRESELEPGTDGSHPPAVDPETGKVIPRAIIVEDAELERLAREQKYGALLRHPALTKALNDPQVRKLVDDLKP